MNNLKIDINQIIIHLMAIDCISKDIHYTAHGEAFYAKHLFVDKFDFSDDIDLIKESVLLGNNIRPLSSVEYLINVVNILRQVNENDDKANFETLREMLLKTYKLIQDLKTDNIVDSIISDIGKKVLQYIGLINLQLE